MQVIDKFYIHSGDDIMCAINTIESTFYVNPHSLFQSDHIFDENQSVKWNREEVTRQNDKIRYLIETSREMKTKSLEYLEKEIIRYIQEESVYDIHFTEEEANIILQATKYHHESEPWIWLDDMARTMRDLIKVNKSIYESKIKR